MSDLLSTHTHRTADAVVVAVVGEVDMSTAAEFATALAEAAEPDRALVVDLDGVRFLGSAGLAVLMNAAVDGTRLVVVAGAGTVSRRALRLTGLDTVLTTVDDRDTALRAPQR